MDRIKPIYKTIESITPKKLSLYESADNIDIISDINSKVLKWAKNKSKEIVQLKENAKYRKEFLGNVSHELKTPLFNLQGLTLTLLDGGIYDNEINLKYLAKSEKNINRLISIVHDLETISRLETGELKLNFTVFNFCELIQEIFEIYEIKASEKKIKLEFLKRNYFEYSVFADKKRIYEVVSNLISNSINYGKENGKTIVEIYDIDEKFLIEITDNGVGIPKNEQIRIFERFYRVDKSRSKDQGGTGLGLSIVKHIIEAHDETINVKSELNIGTTFSFSIKKYKK
jgi:two-component system phosphate regulon sensor histidine kinase PhoR